MAQTSYPRFNTGGIARVSIGINYKVDHPCKRDPAWAGCRSSPETPPSSWLTSGTASGIIMDDWCKVILVFSSNDANLLVKFEPRSEECSFGIHSEHLETHVFPVPVFLIRDGSNLVRYAYMVRSRRRVGISETCLTCRSNESKSEVRPTAPQTSSRFYIV